MTNKEKIAEFIVSTEKSFTLVNLWPFLEYILLVNIFHQYSLQKLNKYDGSIISKKVFYDYMPLEERKKRMNKAKIEALLPYVERLTDNVDENLLKDMYRNLSTTKFKKKRMLLLLGLAGTFDARKKSLSYSLNSSIGHELLHLASACYLGKNKVAQVGFRQGKGMVTIGGGLNEGYTELLSSRIYTDNKVKCYHKEVRIAKLFEFFFDDPKDMQKYYFRHNLPGFINYMQQYIPRKKLINILTKLDYINEISTLLPGMAPFKNIQLSLDLYRYFLKTNPSVKKRLAFERILKENKLVELALNHEKMSLHRNVTPFTNNKIRQIPQGYSRRQVA